MSNKLTYADARAAQLLDTLPEDVKLVDTDRGLSFMFEDGTVLPATGGASAPFDLWDQAVLTEMINRPLTTLYEDNPRLGDLIAPVKSIQSRVAKLQVAQTLAFGVGQFKAPDATPPLYKPDQTWREEIIELALLEEMERISGEDWLKLNSSDPMISKAAGVSLVDRGRILQLRNERLTEKMRWSAFSGSLTIQYDGGNSSLFIDYGLPSGHKPTVSTVWSNTGSADPIADIRSWSNQIGASSGYYGIKLHMSSNTYDYLVRNANIKAYLTETSRSMLIPTQDDILTLLRDGTEIVVYDNGYRAEGIGSDRGVPNSLTRFLPDGKVLVTTDYQIEGVNIAETLDGQVLVSNGYNSVSINQGPQSEVILDHMSKNHFMRVASARIPRLIYPECFLWATVY